MYYLILVLLVLVILQILSRMGLGINIMIQQHSAQRHLIIMFILMVFLAPAASRIAETKTGSFIWGLFAGVGTFFLCYLPIIYIDYLKKKKPTHYKGFWQKTGNWLEQPIKTLFLKSPKS